MASASSWRPVGAIVVGMRRHGYDLSLTHPWVGQVLTWTPTPWRAVQEGAWRALNTPFAQDYSLSEESPK